MRAIVRKIACTKVQVLQCVEGEGVTEIDNIVIEGYPTPVKVRKILMQKYPDQNVFYGTMVQSEKCYKMTAEEFMKHAAVVE